MYFKLIKYFESKGYTTEESHKMAIYLKNHYDLSLLVFDEIHIESVFNTINPTDGEFYY